jgi:hypothetical protein
MELRYTVTGWEGEILMPGNERNMVIEPATIAYAKAHTGMARILLSLQATMFDP